MKINYKIVSGILAACLVYDGVVGLKNVHTINKLKSQNKKLIELATSYARINVYYADKLDEYAVPCDDFDRIVITDLM